jgi:hypothetical protein
MAKRNKKSIVAIRIGERPSPQRHNQNGGVIADIIERTVDGKVLLERFRTYADCPLDVYFLRGKISEAQYMAGMNFRRAYMRAVLRIRVAERSSAAFDREMATLIPIYSYRFLEKAYATLSSAQKSLVIDICGHDRWAGDTYRLETFVRGLTKLTALSPPPKAPR